MYLLLTKIQSTCKHIHLAFAHFWCIWEKRPCYGNFIHPITLSYIQCDDSNQYIYIYKGVCNFQRNRISKL